MDTDQTSANSTLAMNLFILRKYSTKGIPRLSSHKSAQLLTSTKLVVWGSNLQTSVGMGKFTKQVSHMIELPSDYLSIVVGLILSDAWLKIGTKGSVNALLGFKQSLAHADYVLFVFFCLSHFCNKVPRFTSGILAKKRHFGIVFETRTLPCFTNLYKLFYKNKIKGIPENIYDLLTPIALAHWIMGDGSARPHGLLLCTDSYSVPEVVKLMNVLIIKYELSCTLQFPAENHPRIYIRQSSMSRLRKIVSNYFIPFAFGAYVI